MRSEKLWSDSGFIGSVLNVCLYSIVWGHRLVIKYPFTNDVMRIFQHKNDCQSPKQIINPVSEDGSSS